GNAQWSLDRHPREARRQLDYRPRPLLGATRAACSSEAVAAPDTQAGGHRGGGNLQLDAGPRQPRPAARALPKSDRHQIHCHANLYVDLRRRRGDVALRSEILPIKWAPGAAVTLALGAMLSASLAGAQPAVSGSARPGVTLTPCHPDGVREELRCAVYNVFEHRRIRQGRMLPLKIVLIPARRPHSDQG